MKTATFEYKCRRCGAIDGSTASGEEIAMTALIATIADGRCSRFGIPLTMISTHLCFDGGCGVTDLVGYSLLPE